MVQKIFLCKNYMNDPDCIFEAQGEEEQVIDAAIEHLDNITHEVDEHPFSDEPERRNNIRDTLKDA
ncbi:MAG: hypothetical protein ISS16_11685 [Ignavibacteria bacterium]|nr:hypothetical protein [Ignavibacteria bacterium]